MQRSWRTSVDRAVLVCIAFAGLVMMMATAGSVDAAGGRPWVAVLLGAQAGVVLLCLLGMRGGGATGLTAAALAPAGLALLASVVLVASADVPSYARHTLPANGIQLIHLAVIGFGLRTLAGVAAIVATGPVAVAAMTAATDLTFAESVDRWILPAASSITVLVVLSHMRAAAGRADLLAAQTRAAAATARTASNAEHAQDEARRLVHDEIITALRAIELERPPETVAYDVRRALGALAGTPTAPGDIAADLQRDARATVTADGRGWRSAPPPRVVDAFRGAAAEALRNVDRHAGVAAATVTVDELEGTHRLEITDRGRGMPAGSVPGFGIRESVLARMDDVGGVGIVESDVSGTRVRLSWPAAITPAEPPGPKGRVRPLPHRRVYVLTVLPSILANAYLAARFPETSAWRSALVWLALTLLIVLLAVRLGRRSASFGEVVLGPLLVTGFALATYALVVLDLARQPDGALLSAESWVVGYASVGLLLIAFGARPALAVLAIVGLAGTVAWCAGRDPSLGVLEPVGAFTTCLVNGGTAIVAAVVFRRAGRAIARTVAVQTAQDEDLGWRTELAEARDRFLARLDDDVVPYLEAVLAGTAADAPRTAAVLSAQCRDELGVAEPLPESTRELARAARTRGVTLSIRSTSGPGQIPVAAWHSLDTVLRAATDQHVVTVVPPHRPGEAVRIVCIPPLRLDGGRGSVLQDEVRTLVLVWPDPPTGAEARHPMESVP
ncbi:sensor histidine kinase [Nocardioides sp. L-11A]|uniref:sensor histidine kinase n=1 Tax=Nocardioides sp. L-11A TaxID=3043848 RepID=UPI00249B31D8|nr:hypothetical protein QJ852_02635 [Nocardioides sp. L-11A]